MRNLDQAVLDALEDDEIHIAPLAEFDFASGVANLWAGPEGHALEWDSRTWISIGEIGQIDKIAEGQGLSDSRTKAGLRLSSDNIDVIDVEDSRGRDAAIILLLLDKNGQPIGPISFRYTMGGVEIEAAAQVEEFGRKTISERLLLELLNETATLDQTHNVRMTWEAGLRIDVNDNGLEFVADPDIKNIGNGIAPTGTPDEIGPTDGRADQFGG